MYNKELDDIVSVILEEVDEEIKKNPEKVKKIFESSIPITTIINNNNNNNHINLQHIPQTTQSPCNTSTDLLPPSTDPFGALNMTNFPTFPMLSKIERQKTEENPDSNNKYYHIHNNNNNNIKKPIMKRPFSAPPLPKIPSTKPIEQDPVNF